MDSSSTPSAAVRHRHRWSRVLTLRWWLSHVFAGTLIVGFVWAGFWQLDRLDQRTQRNELVESRALGAPVDIGDVLARDPEELDFLAVTANGRFVDGEVVRVANRSLDGAAGDWVIALFETTAGPVLVNRGFITREAEAAAVPEGEVSLSGWLRVSRERGSFGANDSGTGLRVPRLNVADIEARLGQDVADVWLQQSNDFQLERFPTPIPLDALDRGNHLSYAVQWFTFAILSVVIYGLLLRRIAAERSG